MVSAPALVRDAGAHPLVAFPPSAALQDTVIHEVEARPALEAGLPWAQAGGLLEPEIQVVEPLKFGEDIGLAGEDHSSFLVPNEFGLPSQVRHVRAVEGGAFVGTGSLSSLMLLAARERERGILMDHDPRVVAQNRALIDLVNTIHEASDPGQSPEIQRYRFLAGLFLADVGPAQLERIAGLETSPQGKVAALLRLLADAPRLDPASAPEPLRALAGVYHVDFRHSAAIDPEARALAEAILEAAFLGVPAFPDDPDADFPEPRPGERWSVFQRRGEGYFATARMREMWRRYFQDLRVAEADAEHLFPFSDAAWRRLAAMAGENRIQAAQGDFAEADGAMAGLARALREAGVPVTVFYASNAAQHFGDAPGSLDRFLGNLEAFGWAEDPAAVVLLTGTPGPSAPFDKALMPRLEAGLDVWTYHALAPGQVRNAM